MGTDGEAPKRLRDVLPREFFAEYADTPAARLLDEVVVARHDPDGMGGGSARRWPGTHRNVVVWWELANGKGVGWNENVARGWSFPVVRLRRGD